ncbi:FecR family protein [Sinomicrobium soli]|uniref:FecR family protein n=1 Tax=Sinomicrobium sp. N-1-3-6 TaxID=2219864 RepID=UPI000DCE9679|nr:FecR domain-containing protein [Sinomicrobium sp. N-1-3-6]RAV29073.1 hypothetical protein DN748_09105 [Sinomicrobium sp. N-1-3-6]
MNKRNEIKNLLEKYIQGNAGPEEINQLIHILQEEGNDRFPEAMEMAELMNIEDLPPVDTGKRDRILQEILQAKKEHRRKVPVPRNKRWRSVMRIAAVLVLCLGIYTVYETFTESVEPVQDTDDLRKHENVVMKLASGETMVLTGEQHEIVSTKGEVIGIVGNNALVVNPLKAGATDGINEIKVPYGRRFNITLPDSTVVFLNSGSVLQYAGSFGTDERSVVLNGEAYFEVAKDTSRPFIVHADDLNIRVLGTHFNVHNYESGKKVETVLTEGKIALYTDEEGFSDRPVVMVPGTLALFDKQDRNIEINEVNTASYIAWIQGEMIFEKRPFPFILNTLERRFNVEIVNNDRKLDEARFTAKFDTHSLQEILESFRQSFPFEYAMDNKRIIIN